MRTLLRATFENVVKLSGAANLARLRRSEDILILCYHNIVPEGEEVRGDSSLHLPQRAFAQQLDTLLRTHDVVPLESVLDDTISGRRRPRIVISFDDACQGTMTAGLEEISSRGLPATVFVAPGFVGGRSFWWDSLAGIDGLPDERRKHALLSLAGRDPDIRQWAAANAIHLAEVPWHQKAATEEQLQSASGTAGLTFGAHTWDHPNLSLIPPAELRVELERPMVWLRERYSVAIPWLAYPYGLAGPREFDAAARAGYEGALLVEGGWLPDPSLRLNSRFSLPRLNVPSGASPVGFELRISGLLGG